MVPLGDAHFCKSGPGAFLVQLSGRLIGRITVIRRLAAILAVAFCSSTLLGAEPRLENATELFKAPLPSYRSSGQRAALSMRISPDGGRLLYVRNADGNAPATTQPSSNELVLLEFSSGKQTVVPMVTPPGMGSVLMGFNFFDLAGQRLLLPMVTKSPVAENNVIGPRSTVQWSVYDIANNAIMKNPLDTGKSGIIRFAADGRGFIISSGNNSRTYSNRLQSMDGQTRALSVPGFAQSVGPMGNPNDGQESLLTAVFFAPPDRPMMTTMPSSMPTSRPADNSPRILLWDLRKDQLIARLPIHPRNSVLDDREVQWTSYGRFIYYDDNEDDVEGVRGGYSNHAVTRVWDVNEGKVAWTIENTSPVGNGPDQWMVLAALSKGKQVGIVLQNALSGKQYTLGTPSMQLIHACGDKIVYADVAAGEAQEKVYLAKIVLPDGQ